MTAIFGRLFLLAACALVAASCSSLSNGEAAIEASQNGDQKSAVKFAQKDVDRFSSPSQCSPTKNLNCGTLALAYGSLAEYQILNGERAAAESSFNGAKRALGMMKNEDRPSAAGIVYRDVSEGYWKIGDRARAIAVFNEGRAAGGDSWLYTSSAAAAQAERAPAPVSLPVSTLAPAPTLTPTPVRAR
jgi:hypothetical protein